MGSLDTRLHELEEKHVTCHHTRNMCERELARGLKALEARVAALEQAARPAPQQPRGGGG